MQLKIIGETKLKTDLTCPYCKDVAKRKGGNVEVIVDEATGVQYVTTFCVQCKEQIMTR